MELNRHPRSVRARRVHLMSFVVALVSGVAPACNNGHPCQGSSSSSLPDPPPGSAPTKTTPTKTAHTKTARTDTPSPKQPSVRIKRLQPSTDDSPIVADQDFHSERGGVRIDFPRGARATIDVGARARVGTHAPAQLLLASGSAQGEYPPQGNSARPPLRIATPSGTAEIGGSGTIWATVFPDGSAWFAVLNGQCAIEAGGSPQQGSRPATRIHAGQAVLTGPAGIQPPTEGPKSEEAARKAIAQLHRSAKKITSSKASREQQQSRAHFLAQVTSLAVAKERERMLTERHKDALKQSRTSGAQTQQELIEHAQRLHQLRRATLLAYERAQTWMMRANAPSPEIERASARFHKLTGRSYHQH